MITWPPKKRLSLIGFLIQKLAKQWTVGWLRTQTLNYPRINHWVWAPWFLRSCHNFFFRSSSVSVNDAGPQLVILCGSLWPKREGQKKRDEKNYSEMYWQTDRWCSSFFLPSKRKHLCQGRQTHFIQLSVSLALLVCCITTEWFLFLTMGFQKILMNHPFTKLTKSNLRLFQQHFFSVSTFSPLTLQINASVINRGLLG